MQSAVMLWKVVRLFVTLVYLVYLINHFYRAMHFSAKRGIPIACRLFVRLSVRL